MYEHERLSNNNNNTGEHKVSNISLNVTPEECLQKKLQFHYNQNFKYSNYRNYSNIFSLKQY